MRPNPTHDEPLEKLFRFLDVDPDDLTDVELRASLHERGLDPDATSASVAEKVNGFLKSRRLSWQEVARQRQAALEAAAAKAVSWSTRKKEEVEAAYARVRDGSYGPAAQMKLQAAFRNLSNIPTEDKASFLDEVDTLQLLIDSDSNDSKETE